MALRHSFAILALLGSSASWATTTTPALVVCDPCKLTEMSNHAISQGPGIRYMMNLTSNTVKKFEVKYGSGIPNVVSEDIRTSSNEALSVASQTLIAVEQTVEVNVRTAVSQLSAAKGAGGVFTAPGHTAMSPISALGDYQSGQSFDPVSLAVYCAAGPQWGEFNTAMNDWLRSDFASSLQTPPNAVTFFTNAMNILRDQFDWNDTAETIRHTFFGNYKPEFTVSFCDAGGFCADVLVNFKDELKWTHTRSVSRYGAGSPIPSLCSSEPFQAVFDDLDEAREFESRLSARDVGFTHTPMSSGYYYMSCARNAVTGQTLGCTVSWEPL